MNKFACRYAIVRFMPFTETGEFANVGIVLVCPRTGYFGFQLQDRRYSRITGFFNELQGKIYTEAIRALGSELERIRTYTRDFPAGDHIQLLRDTFAHLIHPREAMLRFSEERSILVDDPETAMGDLFRHYVEREFVSKEYIEERIARQLQTLLKGLNLPAPFRKECIGNDEVHAVFPLVQQQGGIVTKIIKPFNLSQDEPNGIYDHGSVWVQKMKRLRNRRLLPRQVLFAVESPAEREGKRQAAFMEICAELREQDVIITAANQELQIVEFAKAG